MKIPEKEIIQFYEERNKIKFYHSRFDFLNEHNGIRPDSIHGLIGTMGSGKSSLFKSIIFDSARTRKVMVWLTEEKTIDYVARMQNIGNLDVINENIVFFEEKDFRFNNKDLESFYKILELKANETESRLIFIDNATTGMMYCDDLGPSGQAMSGRMLNDFCKRTGISIFYVAHTSSGIRDNNQGFLTGENVRGSKQITMVSEYLYSIQKIITPNYQRNFVRIIKHRHYDIKNRTFMLNWEKDHYFSDKPVDHDTVQELFNQREKFK